MPNIDDDGDSGDHDDVFCPEGQSVTRPIGLKQGMLHVTYIVCMFFSLPKQESHVNVSKVRLIL